MATTVRHELEDEFLSTIRKGQEIALDALKPLVEAVQFVIPTMPTVYVPFAGRLPTAREVVADGYTFAEHLLTNQRKFADELIDEISPMVPHRAAPKAIAATKATAPSKATAPGKAA